MTEALTLEKLLIAKEQLEESSIPEHALAYGIICRDCLSLVAPYNAVVKDGTLKCKNCAEGK